MVLTGLALTIVKTETSKTHVAKFCLLKVEGFFFKPWEKSLEEFTYYHRAMILTNSM